MLSSSSSRHLPQTLYVSTPLPAISIPIPYISISHPLSANGKRQTAVEVLHLCISCIFCMCLCIRTLIITHTNCTVPLPCNACPGARQGRRPRPHSCCRRYCPQERLHWPRPCPPGRTPSKMAHPDRAGHKVKHQATHPPDPVFHQQPGRPSCRPGRCCYRCRRAAPQPVG